MKTFARLVVAASTLALTGGQCAVAPGSGLLLISIDGLNPSYVIQADKYELKIPNLRRIFKEGAHARGVRGVLPTVTYPSHTTMLTGVSPARHGIYANLTFDPENKNAGGWYWFAEDIRVPTLWSSAAKAGYVVGSVSWPVSVSAEGVTHLIPEFWRSMKGADEVKNLRALSSAGLVAELEKKHGTYIVDLDVAIPGDWMRTRYAASIIRDKKARVMTAHLAALDHIEHETGPGSSQAFAALEQIDSMVGELVQAMRSIAPQAAVCIVSDHGMARTEHELDLTAAFLKAGLIKMGDRKTAFGTPVVVDWRAQVWNSSGSAAIVLKDANDEATRNKVQELLGKLASDPANGIAAVLDRAAIAKLGGAANASFWVDMKPGFAIGSNAAARELTRAVPVRGTHGFSPTHDVMRASFFLAGPGVRGGASLGDIDMRQIAPTLARHLGLAFETAELGPLLDVFTESSTAGK
jgi:predicted AlkP superfamily pyrophosphatase or phosphodiesterase